MSAQVALVVNPSAGKGRAQDQLPHVAGLLRDRDPDLKVLLSRSFDEARDMVADVVASQVRTLAVMGGDGMMHLGVNACAGSETTLGLIPAGTGNDLCRGIGLDPGDPLAAATVIAEGHSRPLDLSAVDTRFVGAVVGTGFDAFVNRRANALPWPRGSMRYPLAVLAELRSFSALDYTVTVDGESRSLRAMLIAVGNTRTYGGGMQICPQADPHDGWLDVTIIHPVSRAKLLRLLPQMYSGRFARDACVEQLRAREIRIEGPELLGYGDGELIAPAPLTIRCIPGAVRVHVPG